MKITVEEKACLKQRLTLPEALAALIVREKADWQELVEGLLDMGLVFQKDDGGLTVTAQGVRTLNAVLDESGGRKSEDAFFTSLAADFRMKFPPGKIPGTAWYYRCNSKEVEAKLRKFLKMYSLPPTQETAQKILDAAERYNRQMDSNPQYRKLAKYFILKEVTVHDENGAAHNELTSELATCMENGDAEEYSSAGDWTANLR